MKLWVFMKRGRCAVVCACGISDMPPWRSRLASGLREQSSGRGGRRPCGHPLPLGQVPSNSCACAVKCEGFSPNLSRARVLSGFCSWYREHLLFFDVFKRPLVCSQCPGAVPLQVVTQGPCPSPLGCEDPCSVSVTGLSWVFEWVFSPLRKRD